MTEDDKAQRRQRLGVLIRRARVAAELGVSAAVRESGVGSRNTWTGAEDGEPKDAVTYGRIERLFGWHEGSIEDYLAGDGPEPGSPELVVLEDSPEKRELIESAQRLTDPEAIATARTLLDALWQTSERRAKE